MQLGQVEGTLALLDVAQDTAGTDRGELLIITDKSDTRPESDSELDGGVEGEGVGHARFEDGGRGSRGGQAEYVAASFGPGQGQGAHGSGFASAGGGDRELQTSPRRAHLPDQGRLPGIEGAAVRRH